MSGINRVEKVVNIMRARNQKQKREQQKKKDNKPKYPGPGGIA